LLEYKGAKSWVVIIVNNDLKTLRLFTFNGEIKKLLLISNTNK